MEVQAMSILLYTALQSMQPCEKVFVDTAMASNPKFALEEKTYLEEFAKASCNTSNPDALWLLAYQETNFRFLIVRENLGKDFKITRGNEAIKTLKRLKAETAKDKVANLNVDIGVMQFNWRWHGANFEKDPLAALSPKKQVKYLIEKFSPYIYDACDIAWIGCYHNQANVELTGKYFTSVFKKAETLTSLSLKFLKVNRSRLSGEQLDQLPPVRVADIKQSLAYTRSFPRPEQKVYEPSVAEIAQTQTLPLSSVSASRE